MILCCGNQATTTNPVGPVLGAQADLDGISNARPLSKSILGTEFDIHGGGEDLMFPHHENEIAQSGASCNHKPHARFSAA
jgi:hypothetical protein